MKLQFFNHVFPKIEEFCSSNISNRIRQHSVWQSVDDFVVSLVTMQLDRKIISKQQFRECFQNLIANGILDGRKTVERWQWEVSSYILKNDSHFTEIRKQLVQFLFQCKYSCKQFNKKLPKKS